MKLKPYVYIAAITILLAGFLHKVRAQDVFPYYPPKEKPDMELSEAMHRYYDIYEGLRPEKNELFSKFYYTKLEGFDYNNYDGTRNRRDPSKVIKAKGKYYVWYTHNNLPHPSNGVPGSEVWYATSTDAFSNTDYGRGITWGICFAEPHEGTKMNILLRFDCDLSLDVHDPKMKTRPELPKADYLYKFGLDKEQMKRVREENKKALK